MKEKKWKAEKKSTSDIWRKKTISKFKHGLLEWTAFNFKERTTDASPKRQIMDIKEAFSTVKNKRWRDSFDNVHHSDILMWSFANYGLDLRAQSQHIKNILNMWVSKKKEQNSKTMLA